MNSHLPYKNEYLEFLMHLRGLGGGKANIPAISSLLTLSFLVRLAVEDSEPTLRLDLAPSFDWLTRRSVPATIHSNTLLIQRIHVTTLFLEGSSSSYSYAGFGSGSSLPRSPTQLTKDNCALCCKAVYMSPEEIQAEENRYQSTIITESTMTPTPHLHPIQQSSTAPSPQRTGSSSGWATSKYLKGVAPLSLGDTVTGTNGSRSNCPTPRHSLDSSTPKQLCTRNPHNSYPRRTFVASTTNPTLNQHPYIPHPTLQQSAGGSSPNLPAAAIDPSRPSENYGPTYPLCHAGRCPAVLKTMFEFGEVLG